MTRFPPTTLASALLLAMTVPFAAYAQNSPTPGADTSELDKISVTGSRIKRVEMEGPAPVKVITAEQIRAEGFATVYDALQTITEAIGPVDQDYQWGQSSVNAYPVNLRNLGPGRTLLLINGHRVADYPVPYQGKSNFSNFNNIPTGIVERIEILAGSASAIYGSDAMGGVINVVLKDNMDSHVARVRYGEATRGGRENFDVALSGGFTFAGDRGTLVYNLQHFDRGVLLARDRPFMDEEGDKPFILWGPGERYFSVPVLRPFTGIRLSDLNDDGAIVRNIDPPSGACDQYGGVHFLARRLAYDSSTNTPSDDGGYCANRVFQDWALRTGSEDDSGYAYSTWQFNDDLQGWASLGYWKSTGDFNSFMPAFGSGVYWDPDANNGAGGRRSFAKRLTRTEVGGDDVFLTKSRETALDFSAGLRGRIGEFNWEGMLGRATYKVNESFPVENRGQTRDFFLGQQLGTAANGDPIFRPDYNRLWNPISPSDYAGFSDRGLKRATSYLNQAQFVIDGNLFATWAGPVGFAGVLEAGKQGYRLYPEPKTLMQDDDAWDTPFGNIEQGGGDRKRYAVGVEFRVPLHQTLDATLATRYDKYDAVASAAKTTYQLGLEWRPIDTLLVRGSYGTAFRAPDMHFVYAQASSGISDFTDYVACADGGWPSRSCPRDDFKVEDAIVERGGTPNLNYEEGKSWTAGFVWDAFEGFSLSADYWSVKIEDIIDNIDENQLLLDEAYCQRNGFDPSGRTRAVPPTDAWCAEVASRIVRTPGVPASEEGSVRILINPINRANTEVTGVDASARYLLPATMTGTWSFNVNYTNMLTYKSRTLPTDPLNDTRKDQSPRTRVTLSANWLYGRWNATLMMYQKSGGRNNRWGGCMPFADGEVPSGNNNCVDDNPLRPTFGKATERVFARRPTRRYFNGSAGYAITDALKFNIYVSNLFNKIYGDQWCGDFAYCVDDPVGREVAGEIVYTF